MMGRSLTVLMWKHTVVRVRRFIHTTVDYGAPIIFFVLLFVFKDQINPPPLKNQRFYEGIHETDTVQLSEAGRNLQKVLYCPDSPAAAQLMAAVGKQLNLKSVSPDNIGYVKRGEGYYFGVANESLLADFMEAYSPNEAIVIFQDMEGDELPSKLNYTIRMNEPNFQTSSYQSSDVFLGAHNQFGQMYETFMRLQWAIDTSYIEALSPDQPELPQDVSLQEFPYYQTDRNELMEIICQSISYLCWFSLMMTFTFLMARLLEERASGIQELIKMVGVSVHTLGFSHFLNVAPIGLVFAAVVTALLKVTDNPLVPNTDGLLIFLMLLLYFVSVVALAFACSHLARSTQYVTTLAVLVYVGANLPARYVAGGVALPRALQPLAGLLPHLPLYWFWAEVASLEQFDLGLSWSTMWTRHSGASCSAAVCFLCQAAQTALLFFVAWYLSLVRPGQYGQALPWNFLCQRQYWSKNEVRPQLDSEEEESIAAGRDDAYFEPPPPGAEVGIRVANVTKAFGNDVVLKNVSLEVYKGEITVLLGHNGAGKTTLMSIITGMTSATEGKVFVNGKDTETELSEVRQHLGLCPQHNLFFPDLTVQEHIMFFTMLKTGSYSAARESAGKLAAQLGLADKQRAMPAQLSGGQRRRAQLACALAGGADLLVLDEPTSGLDVETRRDLWDLLLALRGSRTVLLTTHFMEEADALGQRVAALHAGRLRCHASTMHLKKAVGTGYRLSITTRGAPAAEQLTGVVRAHVAGAAPQKAMNAVTFTLPAADSGSFPALFAALEARRDELAIDNIGVGVSTLEDVFLKLCSDVDSKLYEDEGESTKSDLHYKKVHGLPLYFQQLCVLIKRQIQYIKYRKWSFLIMQVVVPILIICMVTKMCNSDAMPDGQDNPPLPLQLAAYRGLPGARVLLSLHYTPALRSIAAEYPDVRFERVDNITQVILETGMKDILEYNKYIAGIELNDTHAKMLFTTTVRHAAPVAMNLLSNLLAAQRLPAGHAIAAVNHPLAARAPLADQMAQPKSMLACIFWATVIPFIIMSTQINLVSLACVEREAGTRHLHVMSGCPAGLAWAAALLAHVAVSALALLLPAALAALALDRDHTIDSTQFIGVLLLVLVAGTLAFCASMYLVSFHFRERTCSIMLFACVIIFGILTPSMEAVTDFTQSSTGAVYWAGRAAGWLAPPHALVAGSLRAARAARDNAFCDLNRDKCPALIPPHLDFDIDKCCAGGQPQCYLCTDEESPLANIITLFLQFVVYMTMVILTQRGVFSYLYDRLLNARYMPADQRDLSDTVSAEKKYVDETITLDRKKIPDAMLVNDVHKRYPSVLGRGCTAVQGVSFSIKKGECFGLLGVNGAGKSTTFKMLTAEECPTKGKIFANEQHLGFNNSKYLQTLGYCPQFFGLDGFLTGRDNLALLFALRGFKREDIREEVDTWIKIVGLEKYANRAVSAYSGGCMRRLGAAAALCAGARLALLDEPTAGVDVAARRRVWAALRRALRDKRSVLITSHSMDEMEALCSRIAILSGGRVRALGAAAALRAAHAQGHAVVFKIRHTRNADEVDGAKSSTMALKGKLHETFNCTPKDEHKTMLHYHINETMKYSELFEKLEELKRQFPALIEDYSVTETTLEEVFLSFARAPGQADV